MKRSVAICLLICLLLSGCSRHDDIQPSPQCRVVTGVRVTFENEPFRLERYYTSSSKMRAVLNYLRWIDPYGKPEEDPERVSGSNFQIVLTYSDGCEKTYVQKADRFMHEDGQGWKRIDPTRARTLSQILGHMESD